MTNLEKVEKIREKANVTYEEAKSVLESCDWDMLDAMLKLEADGKVDPSPSGENSSAKCTASDEAESPQHLAESYQTYQEEQKKKSSSTWASIKHWLKKILRKSCDNRFIVKRHGEQLMEIPVLLLAILLLASVWTILIVLAIGLFFGFSYSFSGPDLGRKDINDAMAKANNVADGIKNDFQSDKNEQNK